MDVLMTCLMRAWNIQVKINLGGGPRADEDGRVVPGKMIDMVVEGSDVYLVSLSNCALSQVRVTGPERCRDSWTLQGSFTC